jgi:cytochrome b561
LEEPLLRYRNTRSSWGWFSRFLHWLVVLMIALQAALGFIADSLSRSPLKVDMMTAHKSLGITILAVLLVRVAWRLGNPPPVHPPGSPAWEKTAAKISHALLYVLMFAVPLSGWLSASTSIIPWKLWWTLSWPRIASPDPDLHSLASDLHEITFICLCIVLTIHIAAALKHHFINRDEVLKRMWRSQ